MDLSEESRDEHTHTQTKKHRIGFASVNTYSWGNVMEVELQWNVDLRVELCQDKIIISMPLGRWRFFFVFFLILIIKQSTFETKNIFKLCFFSYKHCCWPFD